MKVFNEKIFLEGKVDYTNIKLLSLYYTLQKNLVDGLAAPMINAVKPILSVKQTEFELVASKVLPFIQGSIDLNKLESFVTKTFTSIDAGEVAPERYLGHQLSPNEIVEQLQMHDAFMKVHDVFFAQIQDQKPSFVTGIQEEVVKEIAGFKIEREEIKMLAVALSNNKDSARSPITLSLDVLRDVVDAMYEATCNQCGPAFTDQLLSYSTKEAGKVVTKFSAESFL